MRFRVSFLLTALGMLAISAPAWARNISTHFDFAQTTKVVSTQLKPGHYRFVVNESTGQVRVLLHGKVVAQVKGQWVNLKTKSPYNETLSTRHNLQEVRFAGRSKALKFPA
ncbi:MAG TPA: hypothetical protein VNJ52_13735 [Patescibacteria group bacterium]|nr:hypothetical protein [Patescibacteria group bacterium]